MRNVCVYIEMIADFENSVEHCWALHWSSREEACEVTGIFLIRGNIWEDSSFHCNHV